MRTVGKAGIDLGQAGTVLRAQAVGCVGVIGTQGQTPVFVDLVEPTIGGDPLFARLCAGATPTLKFARPVGPLIGVDPDCMRIGMPSNSCIDDQLKSMS